MAITDLALLALPGAALVLSIIELGISAYFVHVWTRIAGLYNYSSAGVYVGTGHFTPPHSVSFLLFCSIWSLFVSAGLIAVPFLFGRNARVSGKILGFGTLALNTLTMLFWLAGFAALLDVFGPEGGSLYQALLAFAIMLWLIFLALTGLNFLTAFGVLRSDRFGYHHLFGGRRSTHTVPMTSINVDKV